MPSPKPRLLLLPGMLNTASIFARMLPLLEAHAELQIVDAFLRGSLSEMAIQALLTAGDRPIRVAGFSMGGYVALEVLAKAPLQIKGLALIGSSVGVETDDGRVLREKWIRAARRDFSLWVERTIDANLHPLHRGLPEMRDAIRPGMLAIGPDGFEAQVRAVMARPDHSDLLSTLRMPTAVIGSRHDEVLPLVHSEVAARAIPGAVLSVIEGAGHMSVIEQPAAVASALVTWLATPDATS